MRRALAASFVVLALSGCGSGEPKGTPVALATTPATRIEQIDAWSDRANELLGTKTAQQVWADPKGYPAGARFAEALYCKNQQIQLLRDCMRDNTEDCKGAVERKVEGITGAGAGVILRRRLVDAISVKAEILVAMGQPKAGLAVAEEAIRMEPHPYNKKTKGDALRALGRFQEAAAAYASVPDKGRPGDYILFLQGLSTAQAGDKTGGTSLINEALAKKPTLRDDVPGARTILAGLGI